MKKRAISLFITGLLLLSPLFNSCGSENASEGESSSEPEIESSETSSVSDVSDESEDYIVEDAINDPITRPTGYPTLCGSFMQPGAFKNYSGAQMEAHLQTMYDVGIDMLILQWSFTTEDGRVTDAYFDEDFGEDRASGYDASGESLLETILDAAQRVGVKVFVGLNDSSEWWNLGVLDRGWIDVQADLGMKGARRIYEKYSEKYPDALYGWYFVFEFYNMNAPDAVVSNASYLLNLYRNGLADIDGDMPMMLSPYIASSGATPEKTCELWTKVFADTDFRSGDIFCCQDSVGAGHITMDQLEGYYSAIKDAVDTKEGLLFWANNEDFTLATSSTAPFDRFIKQLNITDKYVSAHITFAYSHYQHPDMQKQGQHEAYRYYYENGGVPECSLSAPEVELVAESNGNVRISGTVANVDKTAQGVRIYKNGELIRELDLSNAYGRDSIEFESVDTNLSGSGVADYKITAVDYFGNESEPFEKTVEYIARHGVNVALDKPYTLLTEPESNYPDEKNSSLTNGKHGLEAYFDPSWVGFLAKPEIIIDLEAVTDGIYSVEINTLGGGSAAVYAPTGIKISVSNNGTDFTEVKTQSFDPDMGTDSSYSVKRAVTLDSDVSARYIKIEITTNQSWIFLDEISVYAE